MAADDVALPDAAAWLAEHDFSKRDDLQALLEITLWVPAGQIAEDETPLVIALAWARTRVDPDLARRLIVEHAHHLALAEPAGP